MAIISFPDHVGSGVEKINECPVEIFSSYSDCRFETCTQGECAIFDKVCCPKVCGGGSWCAERSKQLG